MDSYLRDQPSSANGEHEVKADILIPDTQNTCSNSHITTEQKSRVVVTEIAFSSIRPEKKTLANLCTKFM